MAYLEYTPHPDLRAHVRCYWSLEEFHTTDSELHSFFPESSVRLVFYRGETFVQRSAAGYTPLNKMYMIGFQQHALSVISRGRTQALGVEFYPWGALRLLDLERGVSGIQDERLSPDHHRLAAQIDALLGSGAILEAVAVLEDWLLRRSRAVPLETSPAIQAAELLYAARGGGKIAEVAERVGVSLRQLQRQFITEVGIAPKALARIIRFEQTHNGIWLEPKRDLSQLAFELGYADQAHLTREFRTFAQITPAGFSKGVLARLGQAG